MPIYQGEDLVPRYLLFLLTSLLFAAACPVTAQQSLLATLERELSRSMRILGRQEVAPYFLCSEPTEQHDVTVQASFGALIYSNQNNTRLLDIDLRVGSYEFDNTHPMRGSYPDRSERYSWIRVPIEDDADAIRSIIWYYTDRKYKKAIEKLAALKTNVQVKVEEEDRSADFSREPAEIFAEAVVVPTVERSIWEEKLKRYTAPFATRDHIYQANAFFNVGTETRHYVNSEGAQVQTSQVVYRLSISAFTKAEDGMELPRYESFAAFAPVNLPDDATVLALVGKMIDDLEALRRAPIISPYTGPAVLSGRASGVFFHEVFGHRIEGHRQKREEEGQTFKKKIDEQILPPSFSVHFDPTRKRFNGYDLLGAYSYDNQGVRAQRVSVVENGIFKRFLMSRSPIEGFSRSNGHGRKQAARMPVARQSNLIVETSQKLSSKALKEALIEQCKKEGKNFGLYFEDIQGGFTLTGRNIPNAFNVLPIMVYRVYLDGREELVRGVDLIGTPLMAFSQVALAGDEIGVFNGICGAESGGVPVSAVSPSLLINQVEVQKKSKSQERPPILAAPRHLPADISLEGGS